MPTISNYLTYAETAFAAYASNLQIEHGNTERYRSVAGMASTQAQYFDDTWAVVAQEEFYDGFSATLFQRVDSQGNPSGEKVLAIRGTEGTIGDRPQLIGPTYP